MLSLVIGALKAKIVLPEKKNKNGHHFIETASYELFKPFQPCQPKANTFAHSVDFDDMVCN